MDGTAERVHVFGIRHHGPGSARSLVAALDALRPDALLVEGPPDANHLLPLALNPAMQPPVALLIYAPDEPTCAAYYPFAEYSPEWQAIRWGLANGVPPRMIDLPQSVQLAMSRQMQREAEQEEPPAGDVEPGDFPQQDVVSSEGAAPAEQGPEQPDEEHGTAFPGASPTGPDGAPPAFDPADPLGMLSSAAGYSESEQWWEHLVEQRRAPADLFAAILEAITALREAAPPDAHPIAVRREAAMRQGLRAALAEGCRRIAVVCGAWHTPALARLDHAPGAAEEEAALLSGLPEIEVRATWVPWTNARLTRMSGYGAGIDSPGWYGHLWSTTDEIAARWMIRVARLLRAEDLDISPAHIIEGVRLAEALAALRDRPLPGLAELNEAVLTVFCGGSPLPMRLIEEKLIVGDRLGSVPPETPMAPLQVDFERETKRLKLLPEACEKLLDLDLRRPIDLERSHLLHRLNLLNIPWGRSGAAGQPGAAYISKSSGRSGTFHEVWRLKWQPEFAVLLIEAGQWGSSIAAAGAGRVILAAGRAPDLVSLTGMVEDVLLADLPDAVRDLVQCLQAQAAVSSDMRHLMQALPPLAAVLRYGSVRQTDTDMIASVVDGLAERVFIGLPGACAALNDDAAAEMFDLVLKVDDAVNRLAGDGYRKDWQHALARLADLPSVHGLLAGRACRILYDAGAYPIEEAARRLGLALSAAGDPVQSAAWIEGFLHRSGQLLVHDDGLLGALNQWLCALPEETFTQILPLLRRTFSTFAAPERRSIGERVRGGLAHAQPVSSAPTPDFDPARADAVLPLMAQLLGMNNFASTYHSPAPGSHELRDPGEQARK